MTTYIYYSSETKSGAFKAMEDNPRNIQRVGLETHAGLYPYLYVKGLSSLSDFNQNWYVTTDISVVPQSQISFISVQHYFSVTIDRQKDGWGNVMALTGFEIVQKWQHSRCPSCSLSGVFEVQLIYRKTNTMCLYTYKIKLSLCLIS
jgi:hypothetical protein